MTYETLWHRLIPLYEADEAKAIVRWVLDVRFGLSWADILCGKVTELSANDQTELEKIMLRLEKGEPVQYIIGVADFYGRQFHVEPGVLIPRPETAELCRMILEKGERWRSTSDCLLPKGRKKEEGEYAILDIGTGSGCIAITLALEMPETKVAAWDISDDTLRIASENAKRLGASVTFEHRNALDSSLFISHSSLPSWDLIVSNPPYICTSEADGMAQNVLDYEPRVALFGPEEDPALFYKRIGDYASIALKTGGQLWFELNPLTADEVSAYLESIGFIDIEVLCDQFGKRRFLKTMKNI
jgi:release factor glutamine methyltransferase